MTENGCIDVEGVEDDAVVDAVATAAPAVAVVAGTGVGAGGTAIATTINTHSYIIQISIEFRKKQISI